MVDIGDSQSIFDSKETVHNTWYRSLVARRNLLPKYSLLCKPPGWSYLRPDPPLLSKMLEASLFMGYKILARRLISPLLKVLSGPKDSRKNSPLRRHFSNMGNISNFNVKDLNIKLILGAGKSITRI